eukprot:scaffold53662_cov19-Tisochrysis_lutea.AAC.2
MAVVGCVQVPYRLYFGRQIAEYGHQVVAQYSLKTRPYIGPTSMDTEMAFIMCNQAKAVPRSGTISRMVQLFTSTKQVHSHARLTLRFVGAQPLKA